MKHLLNKWSLLILSVLKPLGIWGVLGFAAVDAAFLGMPLDAIVAGYSYADPKRFLLYSAMGATGSALGSIVIYLIGYKGGEMLLVKRIGQQRFDKITASFERHGFLAIMLPSMLPPPTPFKLFVLSAGVAEMSFTRFLGAIFFGRLLRFSIISLIVIRYGPQILGLLAAWCTIICAWSSRSLRQEFSLAGGRCACASGAEIRARLQATRRFSR